MIDLEASDTAAGIHISTFRANISLFPRVLPSCPASMTTLWISVEAMAAAERLLTAHSDSAETGRQPFVGTLVPETTAAAI